MDQKKQEEFEDTVEDAGVPILLLGEVTDGAQADASVRKLLDRFNHAARLGPSPSVVSEGDRESWPGRPTTLGDAVLPFVLAGTTHHQQVAVPQPPGERCPAVLAVFGIAVSAHLERPALADAQDRDAGVGALDQAIAAIDRVPMGATDCSLPMIWAEEQKAKVDAIAVYTDNETYAGSEHPFQALKRYPLPRKSIALSR